MSPKPRTVIPPANPSMPSIKLYKFVIHIRKSTVTGQANQPSSRLLPKGRETAGTTKPDPTTSATTTTNCTPNRKLVGSPHRSSQNDTTASTNIARKIQITEDVAREVAVIS